jgi:outer membrane lipoprotein-sorting protein
MYATYGGLHSYRQTASTTVTQTINNQRATFGLATELRYQKPDRAFISVTSTASGTLVALTDGQQTLLYRSVTGIYRKSPPARSLKDFVAALRTAGIGSEFDPLYFLQSPPPLQGLTGIVYQGKTRVNDGDCHIIRATFRSNVVAKGTAGVVTFYVDQKQFLLRRVTMLFNNVTVTAPIQARKGGREVLERRQFKSNLSYSTIIQQFEANPALDSAAFTYNLPKDAFEQKP